MIKQEEWKINPSVDFGLFKLSGEKNSKKIYTFFYKNFSLGNLNNPKQTL